MGRMGLRDFMRLAVAGDLGDSRAVSNKEDLVRPSVSSPIRLMSPAESSGSDTVSSGPLNSMT